MLLGGPPFSLRRSPMSIGVPHGSGGVPIVRVGGGPIFLSGGGGGGGWAYRGARGLFGL